MTSLPIDEVLPSLVAALRTSPSLVLRAPAGAGKTTRVPPALLDARIFEPEQQILVLQPRRLAARATAARIAQERGVRLGEEIGYQVRFESRVNQRTRLAVITEGILLRRLLDDPFLSGVGAIVFDEFHERSLASDLALAMVRQIQSSVRPDLKIVVMSATLAAAPIAQYLGDCPAVESLGRSFPVEIRFSAHLDRRPLPELVHDAALETLGTTPGDCLVFLPGVGEIRQCHQRLQAVAERENLVLVELYGDLPAAEQDAVLLPASRRKIILSTNVAETSLTIEGVTAVVDSGLARVLRYDESAGLDRLELTTISRASADQRAGRAGRTQAGVCYRLWPEATHRTRPDFERPEIQRVDLAGAVLQVLCWVEPDLQALPWFERPAAPTLATARKLLRQLGAADESGVTPLGRQIAALPVHPRLGRLLIEGARRGCADVAALATALLSERDPLVRESRGFNQRRVANTRSRSDCLDRVHALSQFEKYGTTESDLGRVNASAAKNILRTRDQLLRQVRQASTLEEPGEDADAALLRALVAAFPDRVARRREPGGRRGLMVGGRGVRLAEESALLDDELFVCIEINASSGSEALVRQASGASRGWLPADLLVSEVKVEFDEVSEKISARKRVLFDDLVLEESPAPLPDAAAVAAALVQAASARLDRVFPADNDAVASFRSRVQCLAAWMSELDLPALDDDQLRSLLPQLSHGRRSFAELRQAPWLEAMKGLFDWQQLQTIYREAPERIEVPSGSQISIQYEPMHPPVVAVRIQEVFGLLQTPRIAGGRVPVLMHLLAPNMRVAQVTDDLASFWSSTYSMVRKDLRARYPKHAWPEDPYTAKAERRPARKK